jgi:hypothetical protein
MANFPSLLITRPDCFVARRDLATDFSGTWEGTEFWRPRLRHLPQLHPVGTFKIHIDASGGMKQKSPFKSDGSYRRPEPHSRRQDRIQVRFI